MDGVCGLSPTLIHFEKRLGWVGGMQRRIRFLGSVETETERFNRTRCSRASRQKMETGFTGLLTFSFCYSFHNTYRKVE